MPDDLRARAAAAAMAVWSKQAVLCEHTQQIPIGALVDAVLAVARPAAKELRHLREEHIILDHIRDAVDEFHNNPEIALSVIREWLYGAREVQL